MIICDKDIFPGPATMITNATASKIKSNSIPLSPVMLCAPFTWNIAPTIIIEIMDAEILFKTPMISNMPGITSANAMIIANSPGIPIDEIHETNPSLLNLLYP